MKVVLGLIRLLGYLLGGFALLSGAADVLGFIPHSYETPPWTARFVAALPSMLAGVVLLVPIRHFLTGPKYCVLAVAYALLVLATAILSLQGLTDYASGAKDPAIVPFALAVFYIPAANAFVLWRLHRDRERQSDNSIKPNPFGGPA